MPDDVRAFHEYNAALIEPWDGPTGLVACDGDRVVASHRNGLRPLRYNVTDDGLAVIASEAGVLPLEPETIIRAGRLEPGRILVADPAMGALIHDNQVKRVLSHRRPYRRWLEDQKVRLSDLPGPTVLPLTDRPLQRLQRTFGYTQEELRVLLVPMGRDGREPVGSMGDDAPLAALSEHAKLITAYFKQQFAQVTNPPIDPQREELVMSLRTSIGAIGNLLDVRSDDCRRVVTDTPVLRNEDLLRLRHLSYRGFNTATISAVYPIAAGAPGLEQAVDRICREASSWCGTAPPS